MNWLHAIAYWFVKCRHRRWNFQNHVNADGYIHAFEMICRDCPHRTWHDINLSKYYKKAK